MALTEHLGLGKPDTEAHVDEEFFRLQQTLDQLDAVVHALQEVVAGKAAADHTHTIQQIENLAAALAEKMNANQAFSLDDLSDVEGAAEAALNYILVKNAAGKWVPSSAVAALGSHHHSLSEVQGLVEALTELQTGLTTLSQAMPRPPTVSAAAPSGGVDGDIWFRI